MLLESGLELFRHSDVQLAIFQRLQNIHMIDIDTAINETLHILG